MKTTLFHGGILSPLAELALSRWIAEVYGPGIYNVEIERVRLNFGSMDVISIYQDNTWLWLPERSGGNNYGAISLEVVGLASGEDGRYQIVTEFEALFGLGQVRQRTVYWQHIGSYDYEVEGVYHGYTGQHRGHQ